MGQLPLMHTLSHLGKRSPNYLPWAWPCSDSFSFLFFLCCTSDWQMKPVQRLTAEPNPEVQLSPPKLQPAWLFLPNLASQSLQPSSPPSPLASCFLILLLGLVPFEYFFELYSLFVNLKWAIISVSRVINSCLQMHKTKFACIFPHVPKANWIKDQ